MSISIVNGPPVNSCSIFASDPTGLPSFIAFVLSNTIIPVPNRVRLDLTNETRISRRYTPVRSPVSPLVVGKIRKDPQMVTVRGSLSATPLSALGGFPSPIDATLAVPLGAFGSAIRRDLREVQKLRKIADRGEPVHVVLPSREVFLNMAMNVDEVHPGTNKVDLQLTFEEVQIVSPASLAGVTQLENLLAGADATQNVGATQATATPAPSGVGGGLG